MQCPLRCGSCFRDLFDGQGLVQVVMNKSACAGHDSLLASWISRTDLRTGLPSHMKDHGIQKLEPALIEVCRVAAPTGVKSGISILKARQKLGIQALPIHACSAESERIERQIEKCGPFLNLFDGGAHARVYRARDIERVMFVARQKDSHIAGIDFAKPMTCSRTKNDSKTESHEAVGQASCQLDTAADVTAAMNDPSAA